MASIIEIKGLTKSYASGFQALKGIDLNIEEGEIFALLGPNGAGKTTCFYSIMGLVKPDSGRILMDGEDVTNLPMYRRAILGLGYLPQETSIFRGMTVEQNISAVLELSEPDRVSRERRLEELLDEFGLTRLRDSAAMALSGGERRRAEIARQLRLDRGHDTEHHLSGRPVKRDGIALFQLGRADPEGARGPVDRHSPRA